LEKDLELTDLSMSYDGTAAARASVPMAASSPFTQPAWPVFQNGAPDFERMTKEQRRSYDKHRLTSKFG
jgi:hypothetical protein